MLSKDFRWTIIFYTFGEHRDKKIWCIFKARMHKTNHIFIPEGKNLAAGSEVVWK